jgi:hypothetical protein
VVIHASLQPKIEVLFQIEELRWKEKKSELKLFGEGEENNL